MASILSNFLNGLGNGQTIKDYRHASNLFTTDDFRLAPKPKFLYQCVFALNRRGVDNEVLAGFEPKDLGHLVKSVELPKINFELEELNQYNRTSFNVSKVNYSPVTIVLHDDNDNNVRTFLSKYYNYYVSDGADAYIANAVAGGRADPKTVVPEVDASRYKRRDLDGLNVGYGENTRLDPFGLDSLYGKTGIHLLSNISIYSLSRGKASQYSLINPVILDIQHGAHDASDGGSFMEHTITVKYEIIKYANIDAKKIPTFGDGFYDKEQSILASGGNSVLGPGGILDTGAGIFSGIQSGNYLGAAVSAYKVKQQLKRNNARDLLKQEVRESILPAVERSAAKSFPTATKRTTNG